MQIDEAIEAARKHSDFLRRCIRAKSMYQDEYRRDSEAIKTVCDALEAFLKKQEEDNSYHTKG